MIHVSLTFNTTDELMAFLITRQVLQGTTAAPEPQGTTAAIEQVAAPRRTRKPKDAEPVVEVKAELTAASAATTATAESLFGGAPVQQAPAPVEQAKPKATQAHLINAFRNLANGKGTDPIVALLGEYKSKSVAVIPEAVWPSAIESAAKLAGLTYAAAIEAPKS